MIDLNYDDYLGEPFTMWFDDVNMSEHFIIVSVSGRSLSPNEIQSVSSPSIHGAHLQRVMKQNTPLEVKVMIRTENDQALRKKIEELNGLFGKERESKIQFSDEQDRFYYGVLSDISEGTEVGGNHIVTITFWRSSPFKYGSEIEAGLSNTATFINVEGTQATKPTFTLDVLAPITFAMVSNGDEYILIGQPTDVDQTIVDTRNTLFDESGQTLSNWDQPPNDDSNGSLTTTGDAIVIDDWGSGQSWHGGVLMREIQPTQDFEVEMYVYIRAEQPEQTFMTSFNLYDENNNELGMMRLWDKTTSQTRIVSEARVGEYLGQGVNYLISDANYNLQGQQVFGGLIRLKREGDIFTFYAARITTAGRHTDVIERTMVDRFGTYAGALKFIEFEIQNHGSSPSPNEIRVEYIKATELTQVTQDETPYIAYPGDVIEFNHDDESILINGEDATYLKDFGASYFELQQGNNQLAMLPNDLSGKLRYRPTYK